MVSVTVRGWVAYNSIDIKHIKYYNGSERYLLLLLPDPRGLFQNYILGFGASGLW